MKWRYAIVAEISAGPLGLKEMDNRPLAGIAGKKEFCEVCCKSKFETEDEVREHAEEFNSKSKHKLGYYKCPATLSFHLKSL